MQVCRRCCPATHSHRLPAHFELLILVPAPLFKSHSPLVAGWPDFINASEDTDGVRFAWNVLPTSRIEATRMVGCRPSFKCLFCRNRTFHRKRPERGAKNGQAGVATTLGLAWWCQAGARRGSPKCLFLSSFSSEQIRVRSTVRHLCAAESHMRLEVPSRCSCGDSDPSSAVRSSADNLFSDCTDVGPHHSTEGAARPPAGVLRSGGVPKGTSGTVEPKQPAQHA